VRPQLLKVVPILPAECMCEQWSLLSSVVIFTKDAYLERTFESFTLYLFNADVITAL
jgi:hypothetical protein